MTRVKKISAIAATAALVVVAAFSLVGCGESVAVNWSHGKVLEETVTAAANSRMSVYTNDDGSYDVSGWTNYIADRTYLEEDGTDDAGTYEEGTGTVADFREYLAKQQVRADIIDYQIEKEGIEISESEITAQVDAVASIYEAYYGGGHAGTFESILNNYFGMTMQQFRDETANDLAEEKLKEIVVAEKTGDTAEADSTEETEDAEAAEADDAEDEGAEADEVDEDAIFDEYIEGLMESYNVTVTECPSDLSYDPTVLAQQNSAATETTEESDDTEDADAEDESADDDAATKEDEEK